MLSNYVFKMVIKETMSQNSVKHVTQHFATLNCFT